MKQLMLLVFFLLFEIASVSLHGQKTEEFNLFGKAESKMALPIGTTQRLKTVAKFELAEQTLASMLQKKPDNFRMTVPRGSGEMVLELHKVELIASDFAMIEAGNNVNKPLETSIFYQGNVVGDPSSIVAISCYKNAVMGNILTGNKAYTLGQKSKAIDGLYTLEQETTGGVLDDLESFKCLTPDVITPSLAKEMNKINATNVVTPQALVDKVVNVYFECDFDMYIKFGSNPQNLLNYVTSMFNLVHAIYRNESIVTRLKSVKYWTATDPYASKTNTLDVLTVFGNQLKAGIPNGANVAHLLSTRSLGGGIAWLDMVCTAPFFSSGNNSWAGPFAVSAINTSFSQLPTYSWTIEVVTHEMGHTLGSPHTQSCSWSGGALDNCYTTEGGCASGPAPVNGGTVMSYCHLTNYGINFNNGFGTQPGNLIRSRIAAQTCLTSVVNAAINVSTNTLNLSTAGSNATVDITTTPSDLYWAASDNANWVSLSLASGIGAAALTITADVNTTNNSRGATVTIAGENATQVINIIQPAANGNVLAVSPETQAVSNAAGNFAVAVTSNVTWTVTSNVVWLATDATSGTNNATLTVGYAANTGIARVGIVTLTGGGISKTITVNQAAANSLVVSPETQSAPNTSGVFIVSLTSNVNWTISSNANWLSTNVTSGSNNGSITTSYTGNTGVARTGVLTISGGGITKTVTVNQVETASLVVSPTLQSAPNTAGNFLITITTNLNWTVSSNAVWLTLSATSGSNNGSVTASYTVNTNLARSGIITFSGGGITKTVTVNQDAASANTLVVTPVTQTAPNTTGNFTVSITSNINWAVTSNVGWLTADAASGSNNGSITASFVANTGVTRTGILTFTGGGLAKTVTVNQDAASPNTLTVTPETQIAPNTAGSFTVTITSNTNWTVSSNAAWLTSSVALGTNNGSISASYTTNTGDLRTGILSFTGGGISRTVTVTQAAVNVLTVSPAVQSAPNTAGSFTVAVTANVNWTVSSNAVWLISNVASGSNNGNVLVSYSANSSTARTGVLTFSGGAITKTVTVNQAAANALVVTPEVQSAPNSAGSFSIVLTANVNWTVSSNAVWLTTDVASGSNNGTISTSYTTNLGTARSGVLTFSGGGIAKTVTVNQAAANTLVVSPEVQPAPTTAGSFTVTVTSNVSWTVSSNALWLTSSAASGSNNGSITANYSTNTGVARTGILTFVGGGITKTVTVNQEAVKTLTVSPEIQAVASTTGSVAITITSNTAWTVTSNAVWLTTNASSGTNSGLITANYTTNTGALRSGVLTISGSGMTKTVTINQAAPITLTITPEIQSAPNTSGSFTVTVTSNTNWTVSSNAVWLTTNANSGSNNGSVNSSYTVNSGTSRVGILTFTSGGITKTVTVTQAAANTLSVTPDLQSVPNIAGSFSMNVTSNINWTLSSNAVWLTPSSSSGSGNGSLMANYTGNTGVARSGTLIFTGGGMTKNVTVNQAGANALSVSPTIQSAPNTTGDFSITVTANVNWTLNSNAAWLTTNTNSGSNNGNVTAKYTANSGAARTGVLTFIGGGITKTVTVNQAVSPSCTSASAAQLSVVNIKTSQATFFCSITSGASTYGWRYRRAGSATWIAISSTSTNSQVVTGLSTNTSYEFQSRLFCSSSAAWTAWSTPVPFSTAAPTSTPPCNPATANQLSVSNITATSAQFNAAVTGVVGFVWRYHKIRAVDWINPAATTNNFVTIPGLLPGTSYEFQVQVNCSANNASVWSVGSSFTTPAPSPIGFLNVKEIIPLPTEHTLQVMVYPNPTTGRAMFQVIGGKGENGYLEVLDLQGRVVYRKEVTLFDSATEEIDLSSEPNGLYVLRLISSQLLNTQKLIKE
jgi:hypothetical protein